MKQGTRTFRARAGHFLTSVFVCIICLIPVVGMGVWLKGVFFGTDSRKASDLATLHIRAIDKAGAALAPFSQPVVTITFDDGWEETYHTALPLLQQYGFPSTQYIIAGVFDNPLYFSEKQVAALQRAGHQVASHTMTHPDLTALTMASLDYELRESQSILQAKFGTPVQDLTSPLGASNEQTLAAIKRLYRSQRNTVGDPNNIDLSKSVNVAESFDRYNIKAYTVRLTTTLADIEKLAQYAIDHNGWLVLTYHQVADDVAAEGAEYGVTPTMLRDHLRHLAQLPIRTATVGQTLDALQSTGGVQ